ncbi:hypothetical protein CJ195_05335 [Bacillus sp. UMB0899]|nr:hypothetical protein CJ195_05335 [Bacillus sp. UMB0899]
MNSLRKLGLISTIILLISSVLTGCIVPSSSPEETTETTDDEEFSGTITMYAGTYSPNRVLNANQKPATELKKLAEEYEKETGIKIDFIKGLPADQDYMTWVRTKASGGQLPDIIWSQWYDANTALAKGTLTDLSKYLDQPNPYVDNKPWNELLNQQIISDTKSADGSTYIINGDYVGTATYFNKEAFEKAGIKEMPTTWSEFIEACQKLKDAGYIPFAWNLASTPTGTDRITWLTRLFFTNFFADEYDDLRYTGNEGITNQDQVIAIKKGVFGSENEQWMAIWPILKDFSQYWQPDFTGGDSNGQGTMLAFLTGEVGMYFDGSWASQQIKSANPDFEWSSFKNPFPDTATSEFATDFDSSAAIGGPSSSFQYAVPTKKANNTLTPAKEKAIVDWLMYITTPEHNEAIVNELGENVPTIAGAQPIEELTGLTDLANQPLQSVFGGINLEKKELDAIYRAFQGYILGDTSLEEFAKVADTEMEKTADSLIQQNNWDLSEYLDE